MSSGHISYIVNPPLMTIRDMEANRGDLPTRHHDSYNAPATVIFAVGDKNESEEFRGLSSSHWVDVRVRNPCFVD
jgi:hypothetical protein